MGYDMRYGTFAEKLCTVQIDVFPRAASSWCLLLRWLQWWPARRQRWIILSTLSTIYTRLPTKRKVTVRFVATAQSQFVKRFPRTVEITFNSILIKAALWSNTLKKGEIFVKTSDQWQLEQSVNYIGDHICWLVWQASNDMSLCIYRGFDRGCGWVESLLTLCLSVPSCQSESQSKNNSSIRLFPLVCDFSDLTLLVLIKVEDMIWVCHIWAVSSDVSWLPGGRSKF